MVARRKEGGGSNTVARTGAEEERRAYGSDLADPKIRVDKVSTEEVGPVGRRMGAMGTRWRERRGGLR